MLRRAVHNCRTDDSQVVGVGDDGQKTGAEKSRRRADGGAAPPSEVQIALPSRLERNSVVDPDSINELPTHEADVCFGSKADVQALNCDVRYTPESGHST